MTPQSATEHNGLEGASMTRPQSQSRIKTGRADRRLPMPQTSMFSTIRSALKLVAIGMAALLLPSLAGLVPASAQVTEFRAKHSNRCLDASSRDSGAKVYQHDCTGRNNQKWKFVGSRIVEQESKHCLDASGDSPGSQVTAHRCHGGDNQMWRYDGGGRLLNVRNHLCVEVKDSKKDNKAQVVVNRCNNNENQIWTSPFLTKGKWFFLVDVTQLSPAGGIGDVARAMANFAGQLGEELVKEAISQVIPVGGDMIVMVAQFGLALALGTEPDSGAIAEKVLGGIDSFLSSQDELYFEVNGTKIWPTNEDKRGVGYPMPKLNDPYFEIPLTNDISVELFEWDWIGDDELGGMKIRPSAPLGVFNAVVASEEEGSAYRLKYIVYDRSDGRGDRTKRYGDR